MVSRPGTFSSISAESSICKCLLQPPNPVFAYIAMSFILSVCSAIRKWGWLARRRRARPSFLGVFWEKLSSGAQGPEASKETASGLGGVDPDLEPF